MGNVGPRFNGPGNAFQTQGRPLPPQAANPEPHPASGPNAGFPMPAQALPLGLAALFAAENALTSAQMAALLRNLLQLPKELVQLLAMFSQLEGDSAQTLMKALLSENIQIPLEALQTLLQGQSKQAQEKLLKLLQGTPLGFAQSGQQLGDLLQALSQISGKTEQALGSGKALDSLHTTLSLYLPYYPLQAPQQFSLQTHQEPEDGEKQGQAKDAALVVFLQTIRLGAIKATIESAPGNRLDVIVEHPLSGTEQGALEQYLREGLFAENLQHAQLLMVNRDGASSAEQEAKAFKTDAASPNRQQVSIIPGQGISAVAVLAAYAIIRAVFEFDLSSQPQQ